jgi:catalase
MTTKRTMTNSVGIPVANNQHSLTAGPRGPVLMQDVHLIEKMAHFNRERIPERIVHAKGSGAYGTFTVTNDITRYTKARVLSEVGKQTEVFVRFSTVAGEKGSSDTVRDPRGFAVKFYTEEGNWDLVGNNTPVFFARDPLKFSDFIHSQKKCPHRGYGDPKRMWDYWAKAPEALHQITILFGDRGIPDGYRHMNGYGSHTFSLINNNNERFWVKFHFKTRQGIKNLSVEKAAQLAGTDPDYAGRDLFEAIERGDYPRWTLSIQVMPEEDADKTPYNPFDLTKVWPHGDFPLTEVGILELNRNPENYFAEVEQSAFCPANVPPGIGFSPDKMLQARLLSYTDAQRYRLGVNYQSLPVNRPRAAEAHTYHRDGQMRFDGNYGSLDNYEPNGFGGPVENPDYAEPPLKISGEADRYNSHEHNDDYTQAGNLFRLFSSEEQGRLMDNIASTLKTVPQETQKIIVDYFRKCDNHYGAGIAGRLA